MTPQPDRLTRVPSGDTLTVTGRSLIPIAFNCQPDIKASFERFKSEEARYDFFYVSRDSLTPQVRTSNAFNEYREPDEENRTTAVTRDRSHGVEFAVEKRFFDTTELDLAVGYQTEVNSDIGNYPYVTGRLRYPLWASREKLGRASEDIFRRNELDDAQLAYIQQVRSRLQDMLFKFYLAIQQERQLEYLREWLEDLEDLARSVDAIEGRDVATDRRRIQAEIARKTSDIRNLTGRKEIDDERFKASCGLPFHVQVELIDDDFNPFVGATHEELLRASMETDPEIATLRNALRNAEVQLDLARRGKWDIALTLAGASQIEGRGTLEGTSDWSASAGFEVSAVDSRVTGSLIRQAQASIARFRQAIAARENAIFVDTLEPVIRIETLGKSREELTNNLPRYIEDYENGVSEFLRGALNIDDLLKRRETLIDQQYEIANLAWLVGANVAELCSATGKFFDLLDAEAE
ncbi:MAG: TolC family protein [Phycisphaerales bacterium]|nr:MAG: TolC family protein [Phycisphaerales bacterium]